MHYFKYYNSTLLPMKFNFKSTIKLILIIMFLSIIAFVFNIFSNDLSATDSNFNFYYGKKKVKLDPYAPVTQIITAKKNNLSQIKIAFRNMPIIEGEKISIQLNHETCNEIIFESIIDHLVEPDSFYNFNFSPITDSKNKKYCLKIIHQSIEFRGDDRPQILASTDPSAKGLSYRNEGNGKTYTDRSLIIKPGYAPDNLREGFIELNKRISQYKPFFLKKYFLGTVAIIAIALPIVLVTLMVVLL